MIDYRNKAAEYLLDMLIFEKQGKDLELSFTAECDKACYYCYLKQFGDKLYPRVNDDIIVENLQLFLKHASYKNYIFNRIDLFTGEFFNLPYWRTVLDILLESDFKNYTSITIPTNFSFVDKGLTDEVCLYKKKFKDIGKSLLLSCSIDGTDDFETRPNKDKTHSNIPKIVEAIDMLQAGMHPMISPIFCKNYKKNIDFWIEVAKRFDRMPMFLEVRNDFWDSVALDNLEQSMLYLADKMFNEVLNKDINLFTKSFFSLDNYTRKYNCFLLRFPTQLQRISCAFQSTISVRVPDLMLIPCHRLGYPELNYAQFIKEDDHLKLESKNLDFQISATTMNPSSFLPRCANCDIRMFCIKGCLGAQYEVTKDPFMPIDSVCNFEKRKYSVLHKIANMYGLYDCLFNDPTISPEQEANVRYVITILNKLVEDEKFGK